MHNDHSVYMYVHLLIGKTLARNCKSGVFDSRSRQNTNKFATNIYQFLSDYIINL